MLPIIAVCGATGTGKSKLAVEIAKLIHGEIINTDAIQLYCGLNIATNKITDLESGCIPHHLVGILNPEQGLTFDVHAYRNACLPILERLIKQNKVPILVGGNHYYLEAILWKDFLSTKNYEFLEVAQEIKDCHRFNDPTECYKWFQELNPERAATFHPNNSRKVKKALVDELSAPGNNRHQQANSNNEKPTNRSYEPRYPNQSIILWLDCFTDLLNTTLDSRVDKMMETGLVGELDQFIEALVDNESDCAKDDNYSKSDPINSRGLLQSIGFKEFADYLVLSSTERNTIQGQSMLGEAVQCVKVSTRQYARRQVRWIMSRFLRRPREGAIPVYRLRMDQVLQCTQAESADSLFNSIVHLAVCAIHNEYPNASIWSNNNNNRKQFEFFNDNSLHPQPEPYMSDDVQSDQLTQGPFVCSSCANRTFVNYQSWTCHLASRTHRKRAAKLRKRQLMEQYIQMGRGDDE